MPKFFCDINVQRLAKWLRFAGFDTMTRRELSKQRIEYICKKDKRIFITRNKKIKHFNASMEVLSPENVHEQLKYVLSKFAIEESLIASRCIECNVVLRILEDDKKYCPRCGKYFWKGTHYQNMLNIVMNK
ncbi:MAG: Mut7-C RNAse domain-containing protein [Candidatus Cloacimonetes bacterium]|nr:Mut7-C RNAse domain-containing protein [Candidatus Cloacimonadota bacterium]